MAKRKPYLPTTDRGQSMIVVVFLSYDSWNFISFTPKVQVSDSTSNRQISPTPAKNGSQSIVLHAQVLSMSVLMCLLIALMIAGRLITWHADMCLK